ncbi:hypothetical protein SAMN05444354_10343 [Stigmatella aurantiaca]|uniref:Cytochrome c domain-containing protein n=1 Tax=Stigmatella aurantiaca TaxID=41 RepID=A0A1H7KWN5_STIAU|nr:hypothetical protein [Stigmatella aurantiaca]SEK90930.1 hypothetical protein SAMN05444354_10343 [Stigmatella aurantiaca]
MKQWANRVLLISGLAGLLGACTEQTPPEAPATGVAAAPACDPRQLACTGLYAPDGWATKTLAPGVRSFTPSHRLWTDGLDKSRFIYLPSGTKVNTANMDDWVFPVGTKLWKEFRWKGRRIETRLLWKQGEKRWVKTTYRWSEDESEAMELKDGETNVPGTDHHDIPSQAQCGMCHNGKRDTVLGFEAVALSGELAEGLTLRQLVQEGLLTHPPAADFRIPGNPQEQAALGYLHMNCGVSCHSSGSLAMGRTSGLRLRLDTGKLDAVEKTDTYLTSVNAASISVLPGVGPQRVVPGKSQESALLTRMGNRSGPLQMPPLGTHHVDPTGMESVRAWIDQMK